MKIDVKLLETYPRNYPRVFRYYSSIQKSDFLGTTSGASVRLGFTSDLIRSTWLTWLAKAEDKNRNEGDSIANDVGWQRVLNSGTTAIILSQNVKCPHLVSAERKLL